MVKNNNIFVGTSGYSYDHWSGPFYPDDLPKDEWLGFYAQTFSTVEINNSFYKLPSRDVFKNWASQVAKSFIFAVKANRYITHMKKLHDCKEPLKNFFDAAEELGAKLGPVLFQLPPFWNKNVERLASFIDLLPQKKQFVFEFRNDTWFSDDVFDVLRKHNIAHCVHDMSGMGCPVVHTADFAYFRFHGTGAKYSGNYSKDELKRWAKRMKEYLASNRSLYAYFNNDAHGYAVENARELAEMLT